jgi:DNA-binding PadR family transcriptional regulator
MPGPPSRRQLPLGIWAVLALLHEGEAHGWALVRALAPGGEVGTVWAIRRALVYRTIEQAVAEGLVEHAGLEPGARGSPRALLRLTSTGRAAVGRWLDEPVASVRDLRSALLLKLLFAQRSGHDTSGLLTAQHEILADTVARLEAAPDADPGPQDSTIRAFRLETARAGVRFVEGELARRRAAQDARV